VTPVPLGSAIAATSRVRVVLPGSRAFGVYYLVTGIWPIVSLRSFQRVTGPKRDTWLVQAVGALVAAIGAGVLARSLRGALSPELRAVAVMSAAGLAILEAVYVARRRISPIYLADAFVEILLILGQAAAATSEKPGARGLQAAPTDAAAEHG
jgi:hypothetical protein